MSFVNKPLTDIMDCVRASTATYVDATGRIRTAGANQPRIDFSSGQGRLLVEEARTNLLTWSEDFSNSAWNLSAGTLNSSNQDSPTGSCFELTRQTGVSTLQQSFTLPPVNSPLTLSVYVKPFVGTTTVTVRTGSINFLFATFDLQSKIITSKPSASDVARIEELSNGWFRLSISGTNQYESATSTNFRVALNSNNSSILVTGAQLEVGSTPSSYIPTQASAVTRAADNVSRVLGGEFNKGEGTFYVNAIDTIKPPITNHTFAVGGNTSTTKLAVQAHRGRIFILGTFYNIAELSDGLDGGFVFTYNKSAGVVRFYIAGNFYEYTNVDLSGFIEDIKMYIGRFSSVTPPYDSSFRQVRYFPKALSESECKELTRI